MDPERMIPIATYHPGESVTMEQRPRPEDAYRTVETVTLAEARPPDRPSWYRIVAYKLAGPWPGTFNDTTFAVERCKGDQTVEAVGFFREDDAREFLCGSNVREYTVYDQRGNPGFVRRQGLGIPETYVDWGVPDITPEQTALPIDDAGPSEFVTVDTSPVTPIPDDTDGSAFTAESPWDDGPFGTPESATADLDPEPEAEPEVVNLDGMSRGELEDYARLVGVPEPEGYQNMGLLRDAIRGWLADDTLTDGKG